MTAAKKKKTVLKNYAVLKNYGDDLGIVPMTARDIAHIDKLIALFAPGLAPDKWPAIAPMQAVLAKRLWISRENLEFALGANIVTMAECDAFLDRTWNAVGQDDDYENYETWLSIVANPQDFTREKHEQLVQSARSIADTTMKAFGRAGIVRFYEVLMKHSWGGQKQADTDIFLARAKAVADGTVATTVGFKDTVAAKNFLKLLKDYREWAFNKSQWLARKAQIIPALKELRERLYKEIKQHEEAGMPGDKIPEHVSVSETMRAAKREATKSRVSALRAGKRGRSVYLTDEQNNALRAIAAAQGKNGQAFLEDLIADYIEANKHLIAVGKQKLLRGGPPRRVRSKQLAEENAHLRAELAKLKLS